MIKKSKMIYFVLIGSCLFNLMSCGSDKSNSTAKKISTEEQLGDEGIYRAVMSPLNTTVAGNTNGTIEIKIEGDEVRVESNITGAPSGVKHLQNIMEGSSCPSDASDANADSLVDISEAIKVSGKILIPLDSDLSNQLDGMSYGPIANGAGNYVYKRSTTLSSLLSDLGATDPDSSDAIVKLPAGADISLSGRVVVIHGIRSSAELPATVVALGEENATTVFPIACGKLVRITSEGESTEEESAPTSEE